MKFLNIVGSFLLLFVVPFGACAGESFEFAFGKEPLVYSVYQKTETKTYVSNPAAGQVPYANNAREVVTKSTAEIRFKFRLTGMGKDKNGVMKVHYEPFDYRSDLNSSGAQGTFLTTMRGLSVKSTQNGITIIDTDKDIGLGQAKAIKNDAISLLLSGSFDMDPDGVIKDAHGDLPFVDFWKQQMKGQVGLFGLELPSHSVTNGETWQVNISMQSSGAIRFEGPPLNHTNTFTLVDDPQAGNSSIAAFKWAAPMHVYDLGGYIEERGQRTHTDLTDLEVDGFGIIHFDRKRHIFVDEDITKSIYGSMNMLVQGRAISSRTEMRMQTQVNLVPAGELKGEDQGQESAKRKTL